MKLPHLIALTASLAASTLGHAGNPSHYYSYPQPMQPAMQPVQPVIASYGYTPGPAVYNPLTTRPGWNLGLLGGKLFMEDVNQTLATSLGDFNTRLTFDDGWGVHVPLHYQFASGLTLGLSTGYSKAHFGRLDASLLGFSSSTDLGGKLSLIPVMANVGYMAPLTESLSWHLGGGLGTIRTEARLDGEAESEVAWNFGAQAFTSLNFAVHENALLNLGYRFLFVKDEDDQLHGHQLEAGMTFRF